MKCLRCEKEAISGNYCQDHAALTGTILAKIEPVCEKPCAPCAAPRPDECEATPRKARLGKILKVVAMVVAISIFIVLVSYRFLKEG
jgi:hypothetical protein